MISTRLTILTIVGIAMLEWLLHIWISIGGKPLDLLMGMVIFIGLQRGACWGMVVGCIVGLWQDTAYGFFLGLHGMTKVIAGILPDLFGEIWCLESTWVRLWLVVTLTVVEVTLIAMLRQSLGEGVTWESFTMRLFGGLVGNMICAMILFHILPLWLGPINRY